MRQGAHEQETPPQAEKRPKVEIGWLLEGDLTSEKREVARSAAAAVQRSLATWMPDFDWVTETLDRPTTADFGRIEPVRLLDAAEADRDLRSWDFVFVVTARELHGRELSRVLGMTSGIFATALVSTAFLDDPVRHEAPLASRLHAFAMHLFGRLNGHVPDRSSTWMRQVEDAEDLDGMEGFEPAVVADLAKRMAEVADLRVEEMGDERQGRLGFYARSLWQNRSHLPRAILRMRPWSFPLKLRRLTTAAGSALAVLVMTAESWEVAANLSAATILVLSIAAVAVTSVYLIRVQHLVTARQGPLREQRAVSNAGTIIAVGAGMAVTYAVVLAVAWLLAFGLFGDPLIASWTGASDAETASVRIRVAALAASLSVLIGALGASFEPYGYFRHVTQIDDEI
ncbi:hypothetical protein [Citreimonas salinaria]|uniref:Uncharacterized protein n=1 Tax=Citreimonas salinaria TaxID=321339 RepID=A0A1H3P048_9RHOB|nr:hypothetical protein [Citreimonas salinaria]SDY94487.1 hypothetical protein SAMN05444340_1405 [Citreimonas salinaria]